MNQITVVALAVAILSVGGSASRVSATLQTPFPRILEQDSTRNNLVTPPGSPTLPLGTLGEVATRGSGPGRMLLIPGFGFGGDIFAPLMSRLEADYTMWAVTLPGFGGTPPPPTPPSGTSYAAQSWTSAAVGAIEDLILREDLRDLVVVGHWIGGASSAVRVALDHPDRVRAVVLLAGSAKFPFRELTPEQRVEMVDGPLSQRWFKTVTRETWDDNNFLPGDYAAHPVLGLRLWREAARPDLHVWIRYLLEFYAQDVNLELPKLRAPTLLLQPGLEGVWHDPENFYQQSFTAGSWGELRGTSVTALTLPGTRIVLWADEPERVATLILEFLR